MYWFLLLVFCVVLRRGAKPGRIVMRNLSKEFLTREISMLSCDMQASTKGLVRAADFEGAGKFCVLA